VTAALALSVWADLQDGPYRRGVRFFAALRMTGRAKDYRGGLRMTGETL
jgi:hypothetical protein